MVEAVRKELEGMSDWELQASYLCTSACKSLIVSLALMNGTIEIEEAMQASRVEEETQIKQWGMDVCGWR